jgi:hypothetical protein
MNRQEQLVAAPKMTKQDQILDSLSARLETFSDWDRTALTFTAGMAWGAFLALPGANFEEEEAPNSNLVQPPWHEPGISTLFRVTDLIEGLID